MSKRVTVFETHAFNISWENLKKKIDEIDINIITDKTILEEFGRLNKAVEYMDKYIKIIDPDINISNITGQLNNLNSHITDTITHLNNFNDQKNIQHLNNANTYIDNCLTVLQTMQTILPKVSGQGIYSMLKKYNDTLDKGLSTIDLHTVINSSNQIKTLKQHLLDGTDEEDSIEAQIDFMLKDTEEKHNKLIKFYNDTLNDTEFSGTTKEVVEKAKNDIESYLGQVKEDTLELSIKIESFEKFYVKVFGELNDEDERVGGLKVELEKRIKVLDDFEEKQQQIHIKTLKKKLEEITSYEKEQQKNNKNLYEQIESLLPSATSAGLATAYHEERQKFEKPIFWWNIIFIFSLLIISLVSFITLKDLSAIEELGNSILHSLPISGPLIWLAIYASTRRSENQRLEQEYAHKEALAKSYGSYKQQIEDLKQEDQELLIKLLDTAITTMSNNASETLDKKHGDGTPVQTMLKSFVDELKKVIPETTK